MGLSADALPEGGILLREGLRVAGRLFLGHNALPQHKLSALSVRLNDAHTHGSL